MLCNAAAARRRAFASRDLKTSAKVSAPSDPIPRKAWSANAWLGAEVAWKARPRAAAPSAPELCSTSAAALRTPGSVSCNRRANADKCSTPSPNNLGLVAGVGAPRGVESRAAGAELPREVDSRAVWPKPRTAASRTSGRGSSQRSMSTRLPRGPIQLKACAAHSRAPFSGPPARSPPRAALKAAAPSSLMAARPSIALLRTK
mmetsp:Transcript_92492/g.258558  ORF Transcript_92492/g.258558 Transcript_92492/m.258558 type:complete len:203 (+) Transcript_92492:165-773(+)